jgi:hypothetical protein
MKKILVAIDASPVSQTVIAYVVGLHRSIGLEEVHLLHVSPTPDVYGETPFYADRQEAEQAQQVEFSEVLGPAIQAITEAGANVIPHPIVHDSPSEAIANASRDLGVDTIVVFDRIRERVALYRNDPIEKTVNLSLNETLSRTILTSGTTLLVVLCVLFIGSGPIKDFAFALTVGLETGGSGTAPTSADGAEERGELPIHRESELALQFVTASRIA